MKNKEPGQEIVRPSTKELSDLAYYLDGMYVGKGDILPLGRIHIDNLWLAIRYLQRQGF